MLTKVDLQILDLASQGKSDGDVKDELKLEITEIRSRLGTLGKLYGVTSLGRRRHWAATEDERLEAMAKDWQLQLERAFPARNVTACWGRLKALYLQRRQNRDVIT